MRPIGSSTISSAKSFFAFFVRARHLSAFVLWLSCAGQACAQGASELARPTIFIGVPDMLPEQDGSIAAQGNIPRALFVASEIAERIAKELKKSGDVTVYIANASTLPCRGTNVCSTARNAYYIIGSAFNQIPALIRIEWTVEEWNQGKLTYAGRLKHKTYINGTVTSELGTFGSILRPEFSGLSNISADIDKFGYSPEDEGSDLLEIYYKKIFPQFDTGRTYFVGCFQSLNKGRRLRDTSIQLMRIISQDLAAETVNWSSAHPGLGKREASALCSDGDEKHAEFKTAHVAIRGWLSQGRRRNEPVVYAGITSEATEMRRNNLVAWANPAAHYLSKNLEPFCLPQRGGGTSEASLFLEAVRFVGAHMEHDGQAQPKGALRCRDH